MSLWSSWKDLSPTLVAPGSAASAQRGGGRAGALALDHAATGQPCRVVGVSSPADLPDWGRWLGEIGFLPGEHVSVSGRSIWGGDPMVVRVGQSTFALRRAEAACVQVEPI